jgi:glycerophosphoryl diester phosphodiesterase
VSFLSGPGPRIIAHRGLAIDAPENTILAFLKALAAGATHLETDIHASADGVAVISHDSGLERVAGIAGRVADLRMAELRRVDLGHGQTFSTLAEALDVFPEALFNIDVKDERAAMSAVEAISGTRATDRVLVTSFSPRRRRAVADALSGVAVSPSVSEFIPALVAAKLGAIGAVRASLHGFAAVQVPERQGPIRVVTERTVQAIHAAGAEVHVWTVDDPADMRRLLALGVDGIVTDRCDLLAQLITEQ